MPRFINHDGLAEGLLNDAYCSGTGPHASWKLQLTNTVDILFLMLTRLESDWESLTPKARRPWNLKELDSHLCLCPKIDCCFMLLHLTVFLDTYRFQ